MFGCEKKDVPPMARSIIIPTPGHLIVEGDFIQAELFVLAYLSGDKNMIAALETPGKDLHDLTAISAFGLKVLDKDGNPVPEQYLLDMAKADIKAFEEYQKTLFYLDQKGNKMDRALFKSTIRVRGPLAA
jgi:hypothetical protein